MSERRLVAVGAAICFLLGHAVRCHLWREAAAQAPGSARAWAQTVAEIAAVAVSVALVVSVVAVAAVVEVVAVAVEVVAIAVEVVPAELVSAAAAHCRIFVW